MNYFSPHLGIHSIVQAVLELRDPPVSVSRELGLETCVTTTLLNFSYPSPDRTSKGSSIVMNSAITREDETSKQKRTGKAVPKPETGHHLFSCGPIHLPQKSLTLP